MGQTQTAGIPTWGETIELIKEGKVKLIGYEIEELEEYCDDESCLDKPIGNKKYISEGISDIDERFVIVYNDDFIPTAVISEYELMNPFVFGDVIVCPGHDSVTCYNKVTGEHTTGHIR